MSAKEPGHLLIVDDNKAIRKLLASHFCDLTYRVTEAASAEEAKKILIDREFAFDLVLSDISMPGESGFDLLTWIKSTAPRPEDLPVLLMTGVLPDAESRLKGLSLGAVDYVVRPDDVTELVIRSINAVDHYRRVRSLERSLEDTQDLAMVGRMLAAANHEIKNIAAIVKISADQAVNFLRSEGRGDPDIKAQVAENLSNSSDLLVEIVRGFKTLISDGSQPARPIDLQKLVAETLSLLSFRTKSCFVVWNEQAGLRPMVRGQGTRLKQIMINLVLNGLEAISELNPDEGGRIEVSIVDCDTHWAVRVRDNGIGFKADTRTTFKAFETTRKLKGGQGLGLWLCNVLAESMGGTLSLSSQGPSQGAEAELRLPKASGNDDFSIDLSQYLVDLN
jgi:two-component system phosphate regulon response regulator OmpR